jgi:hypothetical protein
MSRAAWFHVLGKTKMSQEELEPYLMPEKEFWKETEEVAKP